jgi:O-acetyl-ADP-ribose deacetylase (regulator of RNase III)
MSSVKIEITKGDITELTCDAIVNAANDRLWMGSGVAGAIRRKGGQEIEREAIIAGPIGLGEAIATTAGSLKAKHVIHAAGMGQDLTTSEDLIRKSTESAMRVAEELKLKSVAFPAIGTGVGGFDPTECARVMLNAVRDFEAASVGTVIFCLFDSRTKDAFEQVASEIGL